MATVLRLIHGSKPDVKQVLCFDGFTGSSEVLLHSRYGDKDRVEQVQPDELECFDSVTGVLMDVSAELRRLADRIINDD